MDIMDITKEMFMDYLAIVRNLTTYLVNAQRS